MRSIAPLIAAYILLACTSCIKESDPETDAKNYITTGSTVPEFTVYGDDGSEFNSAQFAGKRSLLIFFTIECPYCRAELPLVEELWQMIKDDTNMTVVAVSRNDEPLGEYWASAGLTMPRYRDRGRSAYDQFANITVPRFYIIDELRTVVWMNVGSLPESVDASRLWSILSGEATL